MIKAEIVTDSGSFTINCNGYTDVEPAYRFIETQLKEGKPFIDPKERTLLVIKGDVKYIRLYEEQTPVEVEPVTEEKTTSKSDKGYLMLTIFRNFFGNRVKLEVLEYVDQKTERCYYIIKYVDGKPAGEVLRAENQRKLIQEWQEETGRPRDKFLVLVPPAHIDEDEELAEYVKDYIKEVEPDKFLYNVARNAKAYHGLRGPAE